jgi:hypothetical protein
VGVLETERLDRAKLLSRQKEQARHPDKAPMTYSACGERLVEGRVAQQHQGEEK